MSDTPRTALDALKAQGELVKKFYDDKIARLERELAAALVNRCPDCKNEFLQQFVCTTCGAEKLYDATVVTLQNQLAAAQAEIAALRDAEPVAWLQITRYGNRLLSFTEPPKTEPPSYCGKPTPDPKNYPLYTAPTPTECGK